MSHGKSQFCTWFCSECNTAKKNTAYDKRRDGEIVKTLSLFCANCHAHFDHKRKDTRKGNA